MSIDNKRNLIFFEASSMRQLYDDMRTWQESERKRLLSISIQQETGMFCCIALTNPTEVVITNQTGSRYVAINTTDQLKVTANL